MLRREDTAGSAMANDDEEIELGLISQAGESTKGAHEAGKCSFCGKSAAEVTCLLAGSGALICDGCIARYKQELKANL